MNRIGFWSCAGLTFFFAALPFFSERMFGYVTPIVVIAGYPVLWAFSLSGAFHFAKQSEFPKWWLLMTAPFALRYLAEGAAMVVFWMVRGFAP